MTMMGGRCGRKNGQTSICIVEFSWHLVISKIKHTLRRNIIGACPSTWSSASGRSIKTSATELHRDLWFWRLHNCPSSWDSLRFWILHHTHPVATAGCVWGMVGGKTNFHRLPHTQCDIWSVGTRHIHQWAPRRYCSGHDQHRGTGHLCNSQHWHTLPGIRFSVLGCRTNLFNLCCMRL